MRFSESWLRSLVSPAPALTSDELADRLTMLGLEVDAVEPAGVVDARVVVAEITAVSALGVDGGLHACTASLGEGKGGLKVVCGAPNVRPGMKAALAQVDAETAVGRIAEREIHGMVSQGMLVSEAEIGLGDQSDEILELDASSLPGQTLTEALALDDACISLDLTPDRGDCLGLIGIARDLAASLGAVLVLPKFEAPVASIDDRMPVRLEAPAACARFLSAVCRGLDGQARAPLWMRERLRRSGLRSIHPAVDVTNYVMLELGRPLHAFDLDKIQEALVVRHGRPSEQLTLLDGKSIELDAEMLVVCDAKHPLSLAGIMGDAASGVTSETRDIVFECAWFNPRELGRTARRLGIQTDSSTRFERGVDAGLMHFGMDRARALLLDISGVRAGPVTTAESAQHLPQRATHQLRRRQARRLIGQDISPDTIEASLSRLGFATTPSSDEGWAVEVPSHRFDIEGEADLVEEIARLHGFDQVPGIACEGMRSPSRLGVSRRGLSEYIAALGYREVISYSFQPVELALMGAASEAPARLVNPMSSDQAVLRRSLVPGLLRVLAGNLARHPGRDARARLFELGRVFLARAADVETQPMRVAGLHCGDLWPESWGQEKRDVDFFDIKGDVERLLAYCGWVTGVDWQASDDALCHPGRGANLILDGAQVGLIGELHPDHRRHLDIDAPVCFFELDVLGLARTRAESFEAPSRFPQVRRDIAVLVKRDVAVQRLLSVAREAGDELLREVDVFDVYQGSGIDENDKSVAIRLVFQTYDRTLRDEEVSMRVDRILESLRRRCAARLRTA